MVINHKVTAIYADYRDAQAFLKENNITVDINFQFVYSKIVKKKQHKEIVDYISNTYSSIIMDVNKAVTDALYKLSKTFPNLFSKVAQAGIDISLNYNNVYDKYEVLKGDGLQLSSSSAYTGMIYTLNVDTTDFPLSSYDSASAEQKAYLKTNIMHIMMHHIMFNTVTIGMVGSAYNFPLWFIEGMAQTAGEACGWIKLDSQSSDAMILAYMNNLFNNPYGAGYLATMYLGQAVSGKILPVNLDAIKAGLDKILTYVANGNILDNAIKENTAFSGIDDFQLKFRLAEAGSLEFVKDFIRTISVI